MAVDNDGNDHLAFSLSSETASFCHLTLELGPRYPTEGQPRVDRIFQIPLIDFIKASKLDSLKDDKEQKK